MKVKSIKNDSKPSISNVIKSKIDIKAGDITFGQRIELGKILANNDYPELIKLEKVFMCLHGFQPKPKDYLSLMHYFSLIADGLKHWIEVESIMLKHEPTYEEKQAGIKELTKNIEEFGTVKALAKAYSQDPDEILLWKYSKVFGILYTDLEEYKYQVRYNKVIQKKK